MEQLITSQYEHNLQCAYYDISKRGLLIDIEKRQDLGKEIISEIITKCEALSKQWKLGVYIGPLNRESIKGLPYTQTLNLNCSNGKRSLINVLTELGYKVPKIRRKNKETKDIEFVESANDLSLHRLFADTADTAISHIIDIRELNTVYVRYVLAKLWDNIFYSAYNVAGTVTGRRGSKKYIFGVGGNAQNFPKYSKWGKRFRKCIISHPGHIFFMVDQKQAEDWPVSALAENYEALDDLRNGVDRHRKLASWMFGLPESGISKDSIERYLGKKCRHAHNYRMQARRLSEILAGEGYSYDVDTCKALLRKVSEADPNVELVFHKYIQDQISSTRMLRTPFGRERQFLGFRPSDANAELLNEACAYIPQSTVGDNTGLAIHKMYYEQFPESYSGGKYIVQEGHDSIVQEVQDNDEELIRVFDEVAAAFKRTIRFHNGIELEIPIEAEVGYNFQDTVKVKNWDIDSLRAALKDCREKYPQKAATDGEINKELATGIS